MNKVLLIGRLGADPELRYSPDGSAVCSMSLATDESYTDRQGSRVERTEWHRVVVFRRQAENCGRYLKKGALVYVEGRLQTRKWQDKNGQDRYITEIRTENVRFLERRDSTEGREAPQFVPPNAEPPVGKSRGGKYLPEGTPPPARASYGARRGGNEDPSSGSRGQAPRSGYGSEDGAFGGRQPARAPRSAGGGYGGYGDAGFGGDAPAGTEPAGVPDDPFSWGESSMDKCPF